MPGFPVIRPRRLRQSAALRALVAETHLNVSQLILPLFARSGRKIRHPIKSMPGVFQLSPDEIVREAASAHAAGSPAVLLFGIPDNKDDRASGAYAKNGIVQQVTRLLKNELPSLLVVTDVCLCEYMAHGHCGIVRNGKILNDVSLDLLARTAVSHAAAGADIVAPSDMMDGRVRAIRTGLDEAGLEDTPIMSYAAKFASAFYGPFRDAAESAPKFGDRRSYQMDAANAREALRETALDVWRQLKNRRPGRPGRQGHPQPQRHGGDCPGRFHYRCPVAAPLALDTAAFTEAMSSPRMIRSPTMKAGVPSRASFENSAAVRASCALAAVAADGARSAVEAPLARASRSIVASSSGWAFMNAE